ncbi:hypothetical protein K438DRAFT_1982442 [Mycena galopus ATCC 62051]|nr:hypothetical protein K438DRAFT_1982442 [Mycena galopus ATCC 62051]
MSGDTRIQASVKRMVVWVASKPPFLFPTSTPKHEYAQALNPIPYAIPQDSFRIRVPSARKPARTFSYPHLALFQTTDGAAARVRRADPAFFRPPFVLPPNEVI